MQTVTAENPYLRARLDRIGRGLDPKLKTIILQNVATYNRGIALGLLVVIVPLLAFYAATQA